VVLARLNRGIVNFGLRGFSEVAPPPATVHPSGLARRSPKKGGYGGQEHTTGRTGGRRGGPRPGAGGLREVRRAHRQEPAPMLEDYAALIRAGEVWVLAEGGEALGVLV
jgi:hypothetical protein